MTPEALIRVAPETSVARLNDERRERRTLYDTTGLQLMPDGRKIPALLNHS